MDLPQQVAAFPRSQSWHELVLGASGAGTPDEMPKIKEIAVNTDGEFCCTVEHCAGNPSWGSTWGFVFCLPKMT